MFQMDKSKAREAVETAQANKGKSFGPRAKFWNPQIGDNLIRLMPPWTDKGKNAYTCYREAYVHWGVGPEDNARMFTCPQKSPSDAAQPCPVCSYVDSLYKSGDPLDKEKAQALRAKQRFYSSIVDMADPVYTKEDLKEWQADEYNKGKECPFELGETKVQIFSYGYSIWDPLITLASDPSVEVTSFEEGYNIIVTRTGKGKFDTEYKVRPEFKPSRLAFESSKPEAEWLPNLDQLGMLQFAETKDLQEAVDAMRLNAPAAGSVPPLGQGQRQTAPGLPAAGHTHQDRPAKGQTAPPPQDPSDEDKPACFGDKATHSDADAECTGGSKKDPTTGKLQTFDPCPFFKQCKEAIYGAPEAPPPRRGRRPAASADAGVADLESQMRANLGGK